jgi:EAL domain-containing protein (putative c-di-GMP-specific phosphodiesterase class I)
VRALELHAFRYLEKPLDSLLLRATVDEALRVRSLASAAVTRTGGDVRDRRLLQASLRRAVDGLHPAFQPIVDPVGRSVMGYEALMRSAEPSLPTPTAVLAAAEKLGALHSLGQSMRACIAAALAQSNKQLTLFVNMHAVDLVDESLYATDAPLAAYAKNIVLELTERASLEGVADVGARIQHLRDLGYRIAIDDLGAGYAGLNYFAALKPDVVKLDMALVRGIDKDVVRTRLVGSIVHVARDLGMAVVGEGVETTEERDALVDLGCHYLQGYLFAKPGPILGASVAWV